MISGLKNNLDERNILALNPKFRQLVSRNTRKDNILTILITDIPSFYHVPLVIPPVPVDVPGQGVPSDHNGVLAVSLSSTNSQHATVSMKRKVRPLPQSLITKFGAILVNEDWSMLSDDMSPTELVDSFEHSSYLISNTFPEKEITVSNHDKPYMTEELRNIRRQRQRAWQE